VARATPALGAEETGEWGGDVEFLRRAQEFVKEVLVEFRKVSWPSRQELMNSTAVVIVVTVVLAFFLGGVDIGLARIVERILR
jgi:preprotein translocase subunit SecE